MIAEFIVMFLMVLFPQLVAVPTAFPSPHSVVTRYLESHMERPLSLAHLTVLELAPPQVIETAAAASYTHVGIRLLPATPGGLAYPLMDDPVQLRETRRRLDETGIKLFDLEIVRLGADFDARAYQRFCEVGAELGAHSILVGGDDREPQRLAQSFAALCEVARPYGLHPNIEFMPWTAVPDVGSALRLVEAAGHPSNAGILVDALHWARSASPLEQVAALPRELLHYAQVCDAPAPVPDTVAGLIHDARCERLLPGEGGIDVKALLSVLPSNLPLSVEIPHHVRAPQAGALGWARQACAATLQLLELI
jgi:sugar phosphate isomerase/epimerase